MKQKTFIKMACSLVLAVVLALTMIVISPTVASAQIASSNQALETLEKGIEFSNKGDEGNAVFFYEEAINQVLKNKDIEVLFVAKTRLADIKEKQGAKDKANTLREESYAGIKALGLISGFGGACGECKSSGVSGEFIGSGSLRTCLRCPRP